MGWHRQRAGEETDPGICWELIEKAYAAAASLAVIPLQDILGLGSEARMNTPGTADGNWRWRFAEGDITQEATAKLAALAAKYRRDRPGILD